MIENKQSYQPDVPVDSGYKMGDIYKDIAEECERQNGRLARDDGVCSFLQSPFVMKYGIECPSLEGEVCKLNQEKKK